MIALVAMGNRCWGAKEGKWWLGVFMMAIGLWVGTGQPLWALAGTAVGIYLWRVWSPHWWMHWAEGTGSFLHSFIRGLAVMPLAIFLWYVDKSWIHLIEGMAISILVPLSYYYGYKFKRFPGEAAELLAGTSVGLLCL